MEYITILTLNTWGGRAGPNALLDFFRNYRDQVDIFCLQEFVDGDDPIWADVPLFSDMRKEAMRSLPRHRHIFTPTVKDYFGLATFYCEGLIVMRKFEPFVYMTKGYQGELRGDHGRNVQLIEFCSKRGVRFLICNVHGLWNGKGKTDTKDRLLQSQNIVRHSRGFKGPQVLLGDFNLRPDTESMAIIARERYRNLVAEYGITDTRTPLYPKDERYADYVFTRGCRVCRFEVLPDIVSDHAALLVQVEI